MKIEPHLTVIDPDLERKRAATPPGMAHWAGTGPPNTTCRECLEFASLGYYTFSSKHGNTLKPGPCRKFESLMDRSGPLLNPHTPSCKYFKPNPTPPSIEASKG